MFPFKNKKDISIDCALKVNEYKSEQDFNFLEYLQGGLNMTLVVGIDFTASNKEPDDPTSLHYLNPPNLNLY